MDLGYKGKVAFVTGAGSPTGFGRKICTTLAEEGCIVVGSDINMEGTAETIKMCEALGVQGLAQSFDVRERAAVDAAVQQALDAFGKIDVLINCAGASKKQHTPFVEMTQDVWEFDIGVNLFGQMNVAQSILPHMIKQNGGRIVNFSGGRGVPGLSTYGAAKAGVNEWTNALAAEVAKYNIYVNVFGPGLSPTGLNKDADEGFFKMVTGTTKQKRLCTPDDVAPIVVFMASDKNSYMTGEFVHI